MQVLIEQDALLSALSQVTSAAATRTTVPILSNVLLQAKGDSLHITGTDLDIEARVQAPAKIETQGSTTVNARELYDIARLTPKGAQIGLTLEAQSPYHLYVQAGRSKYDLPTLPAGDFPIFEEVGKGTAFAMLLSDLARLIDITRHAVCTDETRYYLNGAFLTPHTDDGTDLLRLVATNGNALAMAEMIAPDGVMNMPPVIIPRKALGVIRQTIDAAQKFNSGGQAHFTVTRSKFAVQIGQTTLTSKIIDGSFPDYQRVIPRGDGATIVRIKAADLAKAMDRASVMSREKVRTLKFSFASDGLTISARNEYGGKGQTELDTEHTGDDLETGFNGRLMGDCAHAIGDADMVIHMRSGSDAARIACADDPYQTHIVMPLRV